MSSLLSLANDAMKTMSLNKVLLVTYDALDVDLRTEVSTLAIGGLKKGHTYTDLNHEQKSSVNYLQDTLSSGHHSYLQQKCNSCSDWISTRKLRFFTTKYKIGPKPRNSDRKCLNYSKLRRSVVLCR